MMGEKDIREKINLLEKFNDRLGVGKDTLDELYKEEKQIDERKRTVGNTIFDTVEAANQERRHYVGKVRYETVEEAEGVREELERKIKNDERERARREEKENERVRKGIQNANLSLICTVVAWLAAPSIRLFVILAVFGVLFGILSHKYYKTKRSWIGIVLGALIILAFVMGIYDEDDKEKIPDQFQIQNSQSQKSSSDEKEMKEYIFSDSNKKILPEVEVEKLSDDEKIFAACEILARHGVIFEQIDDGEVIQNYFETKSWYNPTVKQDDFDYTKLNVYEATNLSLLLNFDEMREEVYGKLDESMRDVDEAEFLFPESDKRILSNIEIEEMSEDDRYMIACEILAKHGADFTNINDGGKTQHYFEEKSWYVPVIDVAELDYSYLNTYETANLNLLSEYIELKEEKEEGTSYQEYENEYILPESDRRYLTLDDLYGLDKETLRLARNEIYARHGRMYETDDLREYFNSKSWYHGYISNEDFDDTVFNNYEKENLELIKLAEGIGTSSNINWIGTYIAEDDQAITISSSDDSGVVLTFVGYSEEGWQTKTDVLSYKNSEKTQVSDPYYYDGSLVQETVYTITETGIQVETLPSGGWADGFYLRQ